MPELSRLRHRFFWISEQGERHRGDRLGVTPRAWNFLKGIDADS